MVSNKVISTPGTDLMITVGLVSANCPQIISQLSVDGTSSSQNKCICYERNTFLFHSYYLTSTQIVCH